MAGRGNGRNGTIQVFMKEQLEEAQRRFETFEADAEKVLKQLMARGKHQRRELDGIRTQVRRRWGDLQSRVVEATGVATQAQVKEITREIGRLSKKVDSLIGKRASM
jgi:hypothetical protein